MRLKAILMLVGCCAMAHSYAQAQAQAPGSFGPTAQILDRQLRDLKTGMLVMVDGPKGEWKAKVSGLNADPEWLNLDLQVSFFGAKAAEVEALLRQKYLTGPRPQWVLFGEGARVVATGGTFPDAKAMVKLVEETGIRTTVQVLRDFARRNPDHLEAREALCSFLMGKASRQTLARLGGKTDPLRPADEPWDFAKFQTDADAKEEAKAQEQLDEKPPAQLDPDTDQAIWGEVVDLFSKSFRNGDWIEMQNWSWMPDESAVHSPLMQEMSRTAVPEVERALARHPTSWSVWRLWLALTRTHGGKPIRPLLDSLIPLPTISTQSWPPYAVRTAYVKDARKRRDWTGIRDLLMPQIEINKLWEATQEQRSEYVLRKDGKIQENPETGDYWRSTLEPLAEALLHLGDLGQADDLVRDRFSKHPWSGLPGRASALAQRCGQPGLAAQWGALGRGK